MYGYIYDIYSLLYLEVAKYVGKGKNKPCKSGFEVVELERSRDWHWPLGQNTVITSSGVVV